MNSVKIGQNGQYSIPIVNSEEHELVLHAAIVTGISSEDEIVSIIYFTGAPSMVAVNEVAVAHRAGLAYTFRPL